MMKPKIRKFRIKKRQIILSFLIIGIISLAAASVITYKYKHRIVVGDNSAKTTAKEKQPVSVETSTKVIVPTKVQTVCLDPGHGGTDAGATYGNIVESEINLTVALKVKSILEQDGYKVFMTRTDDIFTAKRSRAYYCNSVDATIMVAIHHNSYQTDHTVNYATALYYKDSDKLLANSLLDATSTTLNIKNEGISKFDNSLLWIAKMPAAMSEAFFITNRSEYNSLRDSNSTLLSDEAKAIATGITTYFDHPDQVKSSEATSDLQIDRTDLGD